MVSIQLPDGVGGREVIHTYRDEEFVRSRFFGPLYVGFVLLVFSFPLVSLLTADIPFTTRAAVLAVVIGLLFVSQYAAYRHHNYGRCSEIRLGDDGTCELETKRRVIRLHVNEIRSVQFQPETDESGEEITICYQGGSLRVDREMAGLTDFLARLKTLNPGADVTGFRRAGWSNLRIPWVKEPRLVDRFADGPLFGPLVICLLLYLASHILW
jgi:hypothetical protein